MDPTVLDENKNLMEQPVGSLRFDYCGWKKERSELNQRSHQQRSSLTNMEVRESLASTWQVARPASEAEPALTHDTRRRTKECVFHVDNYYFLETDTADDSCLDRESYLHLLTICLSVTASDRHGIALTPLHELLCIDRQ